MHDETSVRDRKVVRAARSSQIVPVHFPMINTVKLLLDSQHVEELTPRSIFKHLQAVKKKKKLLIEIFAANLSSVKTHKSNLTAQT